MSKKKILLAVAVVVAIVTALGLGIILYKYINSGEYVPADDEIALHIKLNTNEDIGLLVFDYKADDFESTAGISNADKSLMKRNSDVITTWNKRDLHSNSGSVELTVQIRVITEYYEPNFENIYPDDITKYLYPISWKANFGESYYVTITGDKTNGYTAVFDEQYLTKALSGGIE